MLREDKLIKQNVEKSNIMRKLDKRSNDEKRNDETTQKVCSQIDRIFSLDKACKGLTRAIEEFDKEHDSSISLFNSYWVVRYWLIQVGKERYQKVFKDYIERGDDICFPSEGLESIINDSTEETDLFGKYE
ncbi:MAG: hypothetical protein CMO61_14295 [Verrucomicrobiales bacterium]|nr:hypothetical protein [Verrucomicrobiales bacterium]|tara:strand:- start:211 stop:603 length:393 start_codon:yes stop_codon:yes gene_type:complete